MLVSSCVKNKPVSYECGLKQISKANYVSCPVKDYS
jgi:hypothetical protein